MPTARANDLSFNRVFLGGECVPSSIGGSTYVTPGNLGQGSDSEHYLMTQAGRLLKRHSSWAGMLAGPKAPLGLAPPSSLVSCRIIIVVVVETQRGMEMNEMERFLHWPGRD